VIEHPQGYRLWVTPSICPLWISGKIGVEKGREYNISDITVKPGSVFCP
jgi:hypothetical protein